VSKSWDGNTSDTKIFQERAEALLATFQASPVPRYLVADAKLYTEDNAANLSKLGFITRSPGTLKLVTQVITQALQWDTWHRMAETTRYQRIQLAPFRRTFLVHHMPGSPPTSPSKQSGQRELSHGLCPIPVRSSVWWDTSAGTITPALDLMQFVIDHAVTRVPHLP
jgi:hypothetical protein